MEFDFPRQHEEKVQQASAVSVMDGGESNASSGHLTWVLNWSTSPGVCSHGGKAARVLWSELMWAGRQSQVKAAAEASPLLLCGALAASFSGSLREPADTEPDGRSPVCPPICLSVSTRLDFIPAFLLLALSLGLSPKSPTDNGEGMSHSTENRSPAGAFISFVPPVQVFVHIPMKQKLVS